MIALAWSLRAYVGHAANAWLMLLSARCLSASSLCCVYGMSYGVPCMQLAYKCLVDLPQSSMLSDLHGQCAGTLRCCTFRYI